MWDANPIFQDSFWLPYLELHAEIMNRPHVQELDEALMELDEPEIVDELELDEPESDPSRYQFVVYEDEDEDEEGDGDGGGDRDGAGIAGIEAFLHGFGAGAGTKEDPIDLTSW